MYLKLLIWTIKQLNRLTINLLKEVQKIKDKRDAKRLKDLSTNIP